MLHYWNFVVTTYCVDGKQIVTLGKLSKKTLKHFDLKKDGFYATFNWTAMMHCLAKAQEVHFEPLSKFPAVRRDLAMIFDKNVTFDEALQVVLIAAWRTSLQHVLSL